MFIADVSSTFKSHLTRFVERVPFPLTLGSYLQNQSTVCCAWRPHFLLVRVLKARLHAWYGNSRSGTDTLPSRIHVLRTGDEKARRGLESPRTFISYVLNQPVAFRLSRLLSPVVRLPKARLHAGYGQSRSDADRWRLRIHVSRTGRRWRRDDGRVSRLEGAKQLHSLSQPRRRAVPTPTLDRLKAG